MREHVNVSFSIKSANLAATILLCIDFDYGDVLQHKK
jgi:hypothetical protein